MRRRAAALALALAAPWAGGCAPPPAAAAADVLVLEVAPETAPCAREGARRCLRVRRGADTAWTLWYDPIDGFAHEAGVRVRLEVERRRVARPPADGSAYTWRVRRVLAREPAGQAPDTEGPNAAADSRS